MRAQMPDQSLKWQAKWRDHKWGPLLIAGSRTLILDGVTYQISYFTDPEINRTEKEIYRGEDRVLSSFQDSFMAPRRLKRSLDKRPPSSLELSSIFCTYLTAGVIQQCNMNFLILTKCPLVLCFMICLCTHLILSTFNRIKFMVV